MRRTSFQIILPSSGRHQNSSYLDFLGYRFVLARLLVMLLFLIPLFVTADVTSPAEIPSPDDTSSLDAVPAQKITSNTPAAFSWYKKKAEQGDVEAQFNIGVMCETGWGVPVDNKKAVRWYREAAKQGHADAQIRLGMLYYLGIGARQSEIKGQKWIREAAKQNHVLASNVYKKVFSDDVPDTLLPGSAIKNVRDAYLKNEKQAVAVLDQIVSDAKQQDAREEKQKKDSTIRERRVLRSTEGSIKPEFSSSTEDKRIKSVIPGFIGDASLEENRTLARGSVATIRLQAEKGLPSAQYNLGRMYELGIKLPIDKSLAFEWYEKAAKQAYADAEYRLGIALLYGMGVAQDDVLGKKWLSLAAKHEHAVSKKMIEGLRSAIGSTNISMAANWYIERALGGDAKSSFHLGKLYQYGWGVEADIHEAIKWYKNASILGFNEADAPLEILLLKLKASPDSMPKKNSLLGVLEELSLPVWLAHPGVIALIIFALLWLVFFRRLFQKSRRKKQGEIQEV